ncbi:MAG: acyl-CoA dehydrogenase family protein [Acidimicrobiia bacterium]
MDFDYPAEAEAFRREIREFLEANWDPVRYAEEAAGLRGPGGAVGTGFAGGAWHAKLQEARLVAVHWPEEYGGRGLGMLERLILIEELERLGAPGPGNPIGVGWAGPTILEYGTEEQKRRFLPKILTGEEIWCQLFSEPNAGSDLGSLATRAERADGDEFVVSGQKVWTSLGFQADWGILLARTDPEAPKHRGITYFLIDMHQPGIEVRPLRQMTGGEEFCEVFLDGARVPAENVLGKIGEGWPPAMTTLMNERISLTTGSGSLWGGGPSITDFLKLAKGATRGPDRLMDDPRYRQLVARLYGEHRVVEFVRLRVLSELAAGTPGHRAAVQKLLADRFGKRLMAGALEILGLHGLLWKDRRAPEQWTEGFLFSPGTTIGGGTEEIQKNILGERALGLPKEPSA